MESQSRRLDPEGERAALARQPFEYEINVEYERPPLIVRTLDDAKPMNGIVMPLDRFEVGCREHVQRWDGFPGTQAARRKGSTTGTGFFDACHKSYFI